MNDLIGTFFWASAIALAAPLLLAALGETFAQRAGIFTIGIEGMMLSGAFAAVALSVAFGNVIAGFVGAIVVGAGLGGLYALAVVTSRGDQVVVGIGFNLVAVGATSLLRRQFFPRGMTVPDVSVFGKLPIPLLADIPWVGEVLFNQNPVVYGLYVLTPVASYVLFNTRMGLLIRSAGDNADAAASAGVRVLRVRTLVMLANGACAGAAGGSLVLIDSGGVFVDNLTDGRGYLVLALTMFARWRPGMVALGAVLFGATDALQFLAQATFGGHLPTAGFLMAPYLLALIAWIVMGSRSRAPEDLGKPFMV